MPRWYNGQDFGCNAKIKYSCRSKVETDDSQEIAVVNAADRHYVECIELSIVR